MGIPNDVIWEIQPHTLAKHDILRRYVGSWFPILGKYNKRLVYIDGFCGPGKYKGGEVGSPIVALEEALKHEDRLANNLLTFLFVDERADRIEQLKIELLKLPLPTNITIRPVTNQFECELTGLLDEIDLTEAQLAPTFAFIDPFGFKGLPFTLVSRLLKNPKSEVFVNIMADAINRFIEHPDSKTKQHIVDLFGTEKVLSIAKESTTRKSDLRLLYQEQLSNCARFVRYFEIRDCHGKTIYYLFFASNHPLGHKKIKEAFWKTDPSSGFCFSDATDPNQLVLLEVDETPKLAENIEMQFTHKRVAVGDILKYVEERTAFLAKHMRAALKLLESENRIHVENIKNDGKKRVKNSFPVTAIVNIP